MADIGDKFTRIINGTTRPVATTLSAQKLSGATSATVVSTTGWDTGTAVHGIMYRTDASGTKVDGSQIDWKGVISGTTISNFTVTAGTDDTYAVGTTVKLAPTAAWGDDIATGLAVEHNLDGTHSDITADTLNVSGSVTGITPAKFQNPYKFSVYRNAAQSPGTGAVILFDTKNFDTGTNIDVVTNKGRFTAPIAGFYLFTLTLAWANGSGELFAALYKNGAQQGPYLIDTTADATSQGGTASHLVQLAASDYVEVFAGSVNSLALQVGPTRNAFSGFLVSAT